MTDRPANERVPTFIVIGAMKAGTTSLWRYLRSHPQISMPEEKELDYFIAEKNWTRGRDWYVSRFAGAGDAIAVGEASPEYALAHAYPGVPGRMAELIPD
ncbi:MAG: sulfotransferase family protein, partial [Actinomycetota bacterium]